MPFPRVRFTVRRLMVAVAIVAALIYCEGRTQAVSPDTRRRRLAEEMKCYATSEHPADDPGGRNGPDGSSATIADSPRNTVEPPASPG